MYLTKTYFIEYAHRLQKHTGKCVNIHGHSGKIQITFSGVVHQDSGMVMDFGDFGWLEEIIDSFDHALVLEEDDPWLTVIFTSEESSIKHTKLVVFDDGPPTAENICEFLQRNIRKAKPDRLSLEAIIFEETPGNSVGLRF